MGHRRPSSLSQALRRATGVAACCTVGLAVGVALAPGANPRPSLSLDSGAGASAPAATSPTRVERLVTGHDCWTGAAPDGPFPTRAVVTLPGRRAEVVGSHIGFELWLGRDGVAATGDERAGRLHAFCP